MSISRRLWPVIVFILLLGTVFHGKQETNEKVILDLSGSWEMEGVLPGEGVKKLFHTLHPDCGPARVPGDVYSDLWRVGRIDDPHIGRNGQRAKWVMDYEWWYFKAFKIPKNMENKQIQLLFDGVDYECDVWLNGDFLGNHQGAYSRFHYDVTDKLHFSTKRERDDNNLLAVRLAPPPRTFALVCGRKYRWHGDYGNNVTPFGIWRPVRLEATGAVSLTDTYVASELLQNGSAKLKVQVELFNNSYRNCDLTIDMVVKGRNFKSKPLLKSIRKQAEPGETSYTIPLDIKDPKLWWTWDLGAQNLYQIDVSVSDDSGFQDRETTSFGVRKLEMTMNPGWTKDQVAYPWTTMINDQRHYMRSACWGGPPDMFTGRATEGMYREYIRLAKAANINNLRIFCWHPPEIPLFYQLCDEAGITVWQDFSLSHFLYPKNRETVQKIFDESIDVVKQLRNNPCVIILSGGEEILYTRSDSDSDYFLQLVTELGRAIEPYHAIHWVPTCPLSWPNVQGLFRPNESIHAHRPHYGVGSILMEDYYPSLDYAYVPELAITSCPNVDSIKKFIPAEEVWPPGPSWGYHWADLDILRIHNYEVFGDQRVTSLETFVDATQVAQGVYFQYAAEHFRRKKPKNSGVSLCHFMLHTPDMKWAIVDFYRQPKKSYDYVKRAFQPLLVSLQYNKRRWNPGETFKGTIWVVNDLLEAYQQCAVAVRFLNNNKEVFEEQSLTIGNVDPDSSKPFSDISVKVPGKTGEQFYVELRLLDKQGNSLSENAYFLLIADQKEAAAFLKQMGAEEKARKQNEGGTIRYFKELQGDRYIPTELIQDF